MSEGSLILSPVAEVRAGGSTGSTIKGSPTSTVISDIYDEVFATTPSAILGGIDKICIFSSGANIERCATVEATHWTRDYTNRRISTSRDINVDVSASFDRVRAYSGTKLYFETSITPVSTLPGDTVTVSWTLTISMTGTRTTQRATVASVDYSYFIRRLLDILSRNRGTGAFLTPVRARWMDVTAAPEVIVELLNATLTRDRANRRASHAAANFTANGNLSAIYMEASDNVSLATYSISPPTSVTTADKGQFEFTLTVS